MKIVHGTVSLKDELENLELNRYLQGSDILRQTENWKNGSIHIRGLEENLNHSRNSFSGTTRDLMEL